MNRIFHHPMRRILVCALLLLTLSMSSAAALAEAPAQPIWLTHDEKALPVYEKADTQSSVLRELAAGKVFELVSGQGTWLQIAFYSPAGDQGAGWVTKSSVQPVNKGEGARFAVVNSMDPLTRQNLYKSPRSSAESLGKYFNGVAVTALDQPNNTWTRVRVGSLEGYMETASLAFDVKPGSVPSMIPEVTVDNREDPGLNLRAEQSFQSETLAAYSNGTRVRVLGVTEDFVHVVTQDGRTGFMMAWGVSPQISFADSNTAEYIPAPEGGQVLTINNQGGQGSHLRSRASTSSDSQGLSLNGEQVVLIKWGEYWSQVWADGKTGWMMTKFFQ